jgi:hypothetical protein
MNPFAFDRYEFRRKFWSMIHTDFFIHAPDGAIVLYGRKKGFKLKEDIRLYSDAERQREVMAIAARGVIDFSASYDVTDSAERKRIGVLRRKGMRSILRDEWEILDASEKLLFRMQEDSAGLALLRRFLTNLVPQSFHVLAGDSPIAEMKQHFNPFHLRMTLDFSLDPGRRLDRRLALAAASLLGTIEGRQG